MGKCSVKNCRSTPKDYQLFRLPQGVKNTNQRNSWLRSLGRSTESNVKRLNVCTRHFCENDLHIGFLYSSKRDVRVKPTAVPHLYMGLENENNPCSANQATDLEESTRNNKVAQNIGIGGFSNSPSGMPSKKLGTSDFIELLGKNESYYVDKTGLVEAFLECHGSRVLVTAPRHFGKTVNLAMLKHFFELQVVEAKKDEKLSEEELYEKVKQTENYKLFQEHNLIITNNDDLMKKHFGRYPVLTISFRCEAEIVSYDDALTFCMEVISNAFHNCQYLESSLSDRDRANFSKWLKNELDIKNKHDKWQILGGLKNLVMYMCKYFGRKIVLLVDEYEGVITQGMLGVKSVEEMRSIIQDCTSIIKNAVKEDVGENWIEYAFITGISHISGLGLSGSNIISFKFMEDHSFVPYYGVTVEEAQELLEVTYKLSKEKIENVKQKCNGYMSKNCTEIYNYWSILRFASKRTETEYAYGWEDAGMIIGLKEAFRFPVIKEIIETKLLKNQPINVGIFEEFMTVDDILDLVRIIRKFDLQNNNYPQLGIFFSFLFEQGYLSYVDKNPELIKIPNEQIKEKITKKLEAFDIEIFGRDQKLIDNCREFILKLSERKCDYDDFKNFHADLDELFQQYAATWVAKNEENMRCTMNILVNTLEFTVGDQVSFKIKNADGREEQRYVDYILMKSNFVLIVAFKYKRTNQQAMFYIKKQNYCKILETIDVIKKRGTHFVLMAINMDDNGKVSIGYLQDSQDFDAATYLP